MQAVVKTPRIKIHIEGKIPPRVLKALKAEYGKKLKVDTEEDEYFSVFESSVYKKVKKTMTPGVYLKIYRENGGLTQETLGKKLGVSRAYICDMEKDRRGISKKMAVRLGKLFGTSVDKFI